MQADDMNAQQQQPNVAETLSKSGESKRRKGDLDGALVDFDQALTLQPELASAYSGRGLVRNAKEDFDGALADLKRAFELRPDWTGVNDMIKFIKKRMKRGKAT
jgi:tetratricopeptide (TPR) repeat protein